MSGLAEAGLFDGLNQEVDHVAALLAAGFVDGWKRLDEAASGGALRSIGQAPQDQRRSNRRIPSGCRSVFGRFNSLMRGEDPQRARMRQLAPAAAGCRGLAAVRASL